MNLVKFLAAPRFAVLLGACSLVPGLSGCCSPRYGSGYNTCDENSDHTLFSFHSGRWMAGSRATVENGADYPDFRGARAPSPAYDPGDPTDEPPVPYRQYGPPGQPGPYLRTPPHSVTPDDDNRGDADASDESDDVGSAKPTFKQRWARFWRRPDAEDPATQVGASDQPEAQIDRRVAQTDEAPRASQPAGGTSLNSARPVTLAAPELAEQSAEPLASRPLPRTSPRMASGASLNEQQLVRNQGAIRRAERLNDQRVQPSAGSQSDGPELAVNARTEPIRVVDPPELQSPPSGVGLEPRRSSGQGLSIPNIQVCRQVKGFDNVVAYDPSKLRQGQPILIYAALEDFHSVSTPKGFRTLTLSTLEVRTPDGDVLARQPLGTAVDLADSPRREFFLTHQLTIPEDLPPGDYIFGLYVDDLLGHSSGRAEIAVRVMEGHSLPGGTAGISVSARSPAGSRK